MTDPTRRLAAVVMADVVGYSSMMAADEEGTLASLRAHLRAVEPVILNHGGRIVKTTGDGMLLEFPSATAAVAGAIEAQSVMADRNRQIPEGRRMEFRIGVNLGDILVDESGDIFGDGVNIAARVESIARPGGVSMTGAVHDAVKGKVATEFTDDGFADLKNIPEPVKIFSVADTGSPAETPSGAAPPSLATVAVLPFVNISDSAEQDYFADGIAEDLLTALAKDQSLSVVSRSSSFAYRDEQMDTRTIARELDATHVIEGSVRQSGDRVRVTAQLIDAETGHHLLAERYDRELIDIFDVQDELVDAVVSRLRPAFLETAAKKRPDHRSSYDAWELTIKGQFALHKRSPESLLEAIALFSQAHDLDADLATPLAMAAEAWWTLGFWGWREQGVNPFRKATELAEQAYALDPDNYQAQGGMAAAKGLSGDPAAGLPFAQRVITMNPHDPRGHHMLGVCLSALGRVDEAIEAQATAYRLGSHEPWRHDTASDLAFSHYVAGNYEAAVEWGRRSLRLVADYLQPHVALAAAFGQLGRIEDADRHVDAILAARPEFSCEAYRSRLLFQNEQDRDHIVDGLLKAGLPA